MWFKKIFQIRSESNSLQLLHKRLNSIELELDRMKKQNRKLSFSLHVLMEAQLEEATRVSEGSSPVLRVS